MINALEWSRNGHLVATAGGDGLVRLFDIRTFKELEPLKGHPKEVTCELRRRSYRTASGDQAMETDTTSS